MSRLPTVTQDSLSADQRLVWESVTQGRRTGAAGFVDPETGGLRGPFNALLVSPVAGLKVSALGEALRYDISIDRRLLELATITVGAHWRSNFEWMVHAQLAAEAGVTDDVIEAIGIGTDPAFVDPDEAAVFTFTRELLATGDVSARTYSAAVAAIGDTGVVELTLLVGYYCLISFTLNAFEVPLPPGNTERWPR